MKKVNNNIILWSLLVVVAILWGMSFLVSSKALIFVEPIELLSIRWTLAALLFLALIAFGIIKVEYKGKPTRYLLGMTLFQPCCYSLFELLGIKNTTTSESSIVISLIPIVVIVISQFFLREKYSFKVKGAVIIAFLGVIISTVFSPSFSIGGKGIGFVYLFIAITVAGIYNIMAEKLSKYYSAFEMTTVMTISGSLFYNLIAFAQGYGFHPYVALATNESYAFSAIYLGLGCSFGAYLLYNYILSKLSCGIATCLQVNGVTLVGVISGVIIAGDDFGWFTAVGVLMLIAGIAISSLEGNNQVK